METKKQWMEYARNSQRYLLAVLSNNKQDKSTYVKVTHKKCLTTEKIRNKNIKKHFIPVVALETP